MGQALTSMYRYATLQPLPGRGYRAVSQPLSSHEHLGTSNAASAVQILPPREVPTRQYLQQLSNVKNSRDLAEACGNIAPGRIFRSGVPTAASAEDIVLYREALKVNELVDLRSEEERRDDGRPVLIENAIILSAVRSGRLVQVESIQKEKSSTDSLRVHHVPLLAKSRYYVGILKRIPFVKAISVVFWNIFDKKYARELAIGEINKGGLAQLYEIILETSGPEICHALNMVLEAAESGRRILFFCKIGKDRTGLLAAMVLFCCKATDQEIVSDYVRSDNVQAIALGGLEKEHGLESLDVKQFAKAPAQAMETTLLYLRNRYGNIGEYLASIGFTADKQTRLYKALMKSQATT